MLIAGIDEAGRGSVIGPLVIAGVTISEERMHSLIQLGVKDS
jgi:ribonuclease HII